MFLLDSLLVGGLQFVLDKVATVVDGELNDESGLHAQLLAAHTQLEVGEIDEAQFAVLERNLLDRLKEVRSSREDGPTSDPTGDYTITGVEAVIEGDEH